MYPSVREENFLTIKLKVPDVNDPIQLSNLIVSYYSESTDQMLLRCGNCCNHTTGCPQTGLCKSHNGVTQLMLSRSPKFLVLQLMRFESFSNTKIDTKVIPDRVLQLPSLESYELVTVSNHIGSTIASGHFVTCTKLFGDTWTICNDAQYTAMSEDDLGSPNNYLYVYQKLSPIFKAKSFWQEVIPGQAVPHGCHVKMDLKTGKQFALAYRNLSRLFGI